MNNNANFEEQKEVDCMALAQKRNPGCIITCGKENGHEIAFAQEVFTVQNNSDSNINALNALMDKED